MRAKRHKAVYHGETHPQLKGRVGTTWRESGRQLFSPAKCQSGGCDEAGAQHVGQYAVKKADLIFIAEGAEPTFEQLTASLDVGDLIESEEIVSHGISDNTVEARIIISFKLPDGRVVEHNDVHTFDLTVREE